MHLHTRRMQLDGQKGESINRAASSRVLVRNNINLILIDLGLPAEKSGTLLNRGRPEMPAAAHG